MRGSIDTRVPHDAALAPDPNPSPNPDPNPNPNPISLTPSLALALALALALTRCLKTTLYLGLNYEGLSQSLADMRDKVAHHPTPDPSPSPNPKPGP